MAILELLKEKCTINRKLVVLKMTYFLVFASRISAVPYVSLISTKVVSYEDLAIIFALLPASSILGPIALGYLADKTGQYKLIMSVTLVVGVGFHTFILWLEEVSLVEAQTVESASNFSSQSLAWNGTVLGFELEDQALDFSLTNLTAWLTVDHCYLPDECINATDSLEQMVIRISEPNTNQWEAAEDQVTDLLVESCPSFVCSVDIENVTWTATTVERVGQPFVFPVVLIIRLVGFFAVDAVTPLLDSTSQYMTKVQGGDFGQQKMWAYISYMVIPVFCGFLVDVIAVKTGYKGYGAALAVSCATALLSVPCICSLDVHVKKNTQTLISTAKAASKMLDVNIFFLVMIVPGICWGFHMNYVAIYLDSELHASKTLLGLSLGANGLGATIVLGCGAAVVDRLGPANTVAVGMAVYCLRFVSYYFLNNVWVFVAMEVLEGFCGFVSALAGNYFCMAAAPPGMLGSFNGLLSAFYYGAGRGLGTSVGSAIMGALGVRSAYLVNGLIAGGTGVLYMTAYHLYLKKLEIKRLAARAKEDDNAEPKADAPAKGEGTDNNVFTINDAAAVNGDASINDDTPVKAGAIYGGVDNLALDWTDGEMIAL